MLPTSYAFLVYIFGFVLISRLITHPIYKKLILLLGGLGYFYLVDLLSLKIILAQILVSYYFVDHPQLLKKRLGLFTAVLLILAPLFLAKYVHVSWWQVSSLPLGISYYTFSIMTVLIDTYRGKLKKLHFFDYVIFVSYLPRIFVGPITTLKDELINLQGRLAVKWQSVNLLPAAQLILGGLVKKIVIADTLNNYVAYAFSNLKDLSPMEIVWAATYFFIVIYCDFSGLVDLFRGISLLIGINLPINFDRPYLALNIQDFWRRWHITLTRLTREYIYIPLGGNRHGLIRQIINILIIFALTGIWHGSNVTYLLWGIYHGMGLSIYLLYQRLWVNKMTKKTQQPRWPKLTKGISWLLTMLFVYISWIIFRVKNIEEIQLIFGKIFTLNLQYFNLTHLTDFYKWKINFYISLSVFILGVIYIWSEGKNYHRLWRWLLMTGATLLILTFMSIVNTKVVTNIYVGF